MRTNYHTLLLCFVLCFAGLTFAYPVPATGSSGSGETLEPLTDDALVPPPPPELLGQSAGPSQFMAGEVAVRLILPESNGSAEPSLEDWTTAEIAAVTEHVQASLDWWTEQLPGARLRFHLDVQVVPTAYEPINYSLYEEGLWIGDLLGNMGYSGNYFEKAYAAAYDLREQQGSDWATLIFIANSANDANGRFADNRFAYAYINGPFMVLTSDVGSYGQRRLAPVAAHEMGHIFGALDQYKSAQVPCEQRSGYLHTPTTNSQIGGCPTNLPSIMLSPVSAYAHGEIDPSALAQLGYYDSDTDGIIDPLDTTPDLELDPVQAVEPGERPVITGQSSDRGYPSPFLRTVSINPIERVEYRADDGPWQTAIPTDGAFDSTSEDFSFEAVLYDGTHQVEVRAVNRMGISSAPVSLPVTISGIGAQPVYQVRAPELSNTAAITLELEAPADTTAMQISRDPLFGDADWQPYEPRPLVQLQAGYDEAQPVYVRFRDANGYISPAYMQEILVDTNPPVGKVVLKRSSSMLAVLQAEDQGSGVDTVEIEVNDGENVWHLEATEVERQLTAEDDPDHSYYAEVPLPAGVISVRVCFRDMAGNVSPYLEARAQNSVYLPLVIAP